MLTDIFAYRYLEKPIWQNYSDLERRLLNQSIGIVKDVIPYYDKGGNKNKVNSEKWKSIHDRLARELGVNELSKRYYSYTQKNHLGNEMPVSGSFSWDHVCEQFVNTPYSNQYNPDSFIKERLSFVELALRLREDELSEFNQSLSERIAKAEIDEIIRNSRKSKNPNRGNVAEQMTTWNENTNATFNSQIDELNERFRQAKAPLTYHNGFIQISSDEIIEKSIAKPFWDIVSDPIWKNVDIDMKEALDQRDSNGKDPVIFAAKALESAVKIISDNKGWTRGSEKGAANYIDNLVSKDNGRFIDVWESDMLKDYFIKVRNSLGHGPGSKPMPQLNASQTDWAIESAMSWVRTLVSRMQK